MKKVQDYLKELDREKLVDAYFERIPGGNAGLFDDEYLTEETCDEPGDEPDIKKYSLYMDACAAIIRFNSYCRAKEVLALKDCLQGEQFLRENLPWMMAEAEKKTKK